MQLSDIFKDTDAVMEALDETLFQKYLKWLSELSEKKKKEIEEELKNKEFTFKDIIKIFDGEEKT